MKYIKKINKTNLLFLLLIGIFFLLYFGIYLTENKIAWYAEMWNQAIILLNELITIGR